MGGETESLLGAGRALGVKILTTAVFITQHGTKLTEGSQRVHEQVKGKF